MPPPVAVITEIERADVSTGLSYPALVAAFERELPQLDPATIAGLAERKAPWDEVEREIGRIAGPRGLMILGRFSQGAITSLAGQVLQCSLYIVGNPVIAARILAIDVRASLYVPFRVALCDHGEPGGARIAFDRPSSSLGTLGRPELSEFGTLLDQKIDSVVAAIAG
jgi:uncharacterized protein (DUF302 family)